ncbi:MAG: hypothetical protein J0M12_09860 [Deltaproteobacteria bacterium]|nr:hypothetical protein [Deltaproteobacteria bacterium]
MKKMTVLLLGAMFLAPLTSVADAGHSHGHADAKSEKKHNDEAHSKSKAELVAELSTVMSQIETAVVAKDAGKLHDLTEALPHLAGHIAEKAPEAATARAQGSAKNINTLSAKLHAEADKGDFEAAAITAKKLSGMVNIFKGQVA